jgi:hypothetical protein
LHERIGSGREYDAFRRTIGNEEPAVVGGPHAGRYVEQPLSHCGDDFAAGYADFAGIESSVVVDVRENAAGERDGAADADQDGRFVR